MAVVFLPVALHETVAAAGAGGMCDSFLGDTDNGLPCKRQVRVTLLERQIRASVSSWSSSMHRSSIQDNTPYLRYHIPKAKRIPYNLYWPLSE